MEKRCTIPCHNFSESGSRASHPSRRRCQKGLPTQPVHLCFFLSGPATALPTALPTERILEPARARHFGACAIGITLGASEGVNHSLSLVTWHGRFAQVTQGEMPLPPAGMYSPELIEFISLCMERDPADRPTALALLHHPWIQVCVCVCVCVMPCALLYALLPPLAVLETRLSIAAERLRNKSCEIACSGRKFYSSRQGPH